MTQPAATSDANAMSAPDHAGTIARAYPSMQPTQTPPNVDLSTDFTEHLAAGGYPDIEEAGVAYAQGQRMAARATENRTALTTGAADGAMSYPTNPQHPGNAKQAQPVQPDPDNG